MKEDSEFSDKWKGPLLGLLVLAVLTGFILSVIYNPGKPVTPRSKVVHTITVLPAPVEMREPTIPKPPTPTPTPAPVTTRESAPQNSPSKSAPPENRSAPKNAANRDNAKPALGTSAPFGQDGFGVGPGDADGVGLEGGNGQFLAGTHRASYLSYGQHLQGILARKVQELEKAVKVQNTLTLVIHLWVGAEGGITRVELITSSGDKTIDSRLASALKSLDGQIKPPPQGLPQPIKIRIRS